MTIGITWSWMSMGLLLLVMPGIPVMGMERQSPSSHQQSSVGGGAPTSESLDERIRRADMAYGQGLVDYEQAKEDDCFASRSEVVADLKRTRADLAQAEAAYREILRMDPSQDDVERRLEAVLAVGKTCCGRIGLFERYGVR